MPTKGYIYRIVSNETVDRPYYGSTDSDPAYRFFQHKKAHERYLAGRSNFVSSYLILNYPSARVETVETFDFEDKSELKKREGYYQANFPCVNRNIAGRSTKDSQKANYEANKAARQAKQREYYAAHKDAAKAYYTANKDKVSTYNKERYEKKKSVTELTNELNRLMLIDA